MVFEADTPMHAETKTHVNGIPGRGGEMDAVKQVIQHHPKQTGPKQPISEQAYQMPPWLFQHQELFQVLQQAQSIDQASLRNTLNHLHFMECHILVHLRHPRYEESFLVRAYPEACLGNEMTGRWSQDTLSGLEWDHFRFLHLILDDGRFLIMVPALLKEMDRTGLKVQLPDKSFAVAKRRARRFFCKHSTAELIQNSFVARGDLIDFNALAFRIRVKPEAPCSFNWFNMDEHMIINLRQENKIFFSGTCRRIRSQRHFSEKEIVVTPVKDEINRFRKRTIRNPRQKLLPRPLIVFNHPFLKKKVQRMVFDLSSSGFSVFESTEDGVLIPGMIITDLCIHFAGNLHIRCDAQVIYRKEMEKKQAHCGLVILDMDIKNYSRLTDILTNAMDPHAHTSGALDMEALWEFFFETGFIYPKKYGIIQGHRQGFKETYQRLYEENPEIIRHFTYQSDGKIYGHISMLRAYERTWLIHHHAARPMDGKRPGFVVLKQIMHYLNDAHRLPSTKMDYVMCYYRPENKFPDRVFGGFAKDLEDPRGCSMDLFCYLPYPSLSLGTRLPKDWSIQASDAADLWELSRFYHDESGGLMLDAMGLGTDPSEADSVPKLYQRLGFLRRWGFYSLKHHDRLMAVMILNQSTLGFNLSELLNGLKIVVTRGDELPWETLSKAVGQLIGKYNMNKIPLMFYPQSYVQARGVPYEKKYQLWVLNVRYGNEYMEYMNKRFRIGFKPSDPSMS